jgi:phosphoglycerate dehydrogenase-like enzyme
MRGVHGPAIADHAMAMLLSLTRNLRFYDAAQRQGEWAERDTPTPCVSLHGRTMLVVGMGGIGEEIARRAHGFGMRVIATRRSETPAPDFVERVGKPDQLLGMLPDADVVAICVPLTSETENLFDAKAFAAMKKGSYLINIARGRIVNTDALLAALQSGHLAGACLDVTDPEPLPADHPLWKEPNVIITPHMAAAGEVTEQRHRLLRMENIRRFAAGEPLLNVVDKKAGY